MSKVPLPVKKDIKDASSTNEKFIEDLNKELGTSFKLELDYEQLYQDTKDNADYGSRPGEVSNWYIEALVRGIKEFAKKDELYKEALVEEVKSIKGIRFEDSDEPFYCKLALEDDAFVIVVRKDRYPTNVDEVGTKNIEELF